MIRIHKRSFESIEKMHRVNRRKFGIHWRSSEPRRNSSQPDCEPLHAYTRHSSYLTFLPRPGSDKWMKEVTGIIIVRRSVNGVERKKKYILTYFRNNWLNLGSSYQILLFVQLQIMFTAYFRITFTFQFNQMFRYIYIFLSELRS